MSLDHNMLPRALNNQSTLKKAYLQNTQQEGNMNYAYLTNWIAYLDKSISLIKFHVTDSQQFFPKIPKKQKPTEDHLNHLAFSTAIPAQSQ